MFSRRTLLPWTGIILLSALFLMGQQTWPPDVYPIYCQDDDLDGYGVHPAILCPYLIYLDCDDTNPDVNPGAFEICNGIDDNCDLIVDNADADRDGYIDDDPTCGGDDCDDANPNVYPGAPEVCNGIDDDCDTIVDDVDADGDGHVTDDPACGGDDCNDMNPYVYAGAVEICDGLDNDCDSTIPAAETDDDGDQFVECTPWAGLDPGILGGDDCDDSRADVNPGVIEAAYGDPICADGLDNDCDGLIDSQDNGCELCASPADCDDSDPCTDDSCVGGLCEYTYNIDPCDDGDACTANDVCSGGVCTAGPPLDCDDANVCTDDACDLALGCQYTNNTGICDDGDACTEYAFCSGGVCTAGPPLDCDDANVCTDDACDLAWGCQYLYNTATCDDLDACTANDVCSGGICSGTPVEESLAAGNCNDLIDNDCDGLVDGADPGCQL
jgi:hypothetical protein